MQFSWQLKGADEKLARAKASGEMTRRRDIKSNLSRAGTSRSGDWTKKTGTGILHSRDRTKVLQTIGARADRLVINVLPRAPPSLFAWRKLSPICPPPFCAISEHRHDLYHEVAS